MGNEKLSNRTGIPRQEFPIRSSGHAVVGGLDDLFGRQLILDPKKEVYQNLGYNTSAMNFLLASVFLTAFLFLWLYIRSEGLAEVRRKIRPSSGERILFYSSKLVILGSLAFWGWIVFDIVTRPSIHPINWVNVVLVFCLSWLGAVAISYLINKILLDRKTIWIKQSFSTYKSQEDLGYLNDKEAHL